MNRLLEIGFQLAGYWKLEETHLQLDLARFATRRNVLYAFVADAEIKYIGKTVTPLAVRLRGYVNPAKTQTTNLKGHARITELLQLGAAVEIFALPDNGLLRYGGFHVNLAAGLEDDLIRSIAPPWNGGGVRTTTRPQAASGDPSDEARPLAPVDQPVLVSKASFTFVLQASYYRQGFFNVTVDNQGLIGGDGDHIEIYLADEPVPLTGAINRSANTNHTPRIMGGVALRDWFAETAAEMTSITVEVFSPTSIRLTAAGGVV
jgi:hypothetical protein